MAKSFLYRTDLPRGLRNNNPGNLVRTSINWVGKIPHHENSDTRFEQFREMKYGIRAMIMDLLNDYKKGSNTLSKLITEYAPSSENDTAAYIRFVSSKTGIAANMVFSPTSENMVKIVRAMIEKEIGTTYISYVTVVDVREALSLVNSDLIIKTSIGLGAVAITGGIIYLLYNIS